MFPALRIIQHYRTVYPQPPYCGCSFSAHIPESTGYTNTTCPSEELGAAQARRTFAGIFERASCWNRFFRPLNPFPASKRRFWRNSLSNCSAHVPHIAGLLLCSGSLDSRCADGNNAMCYLFSDLPWGFDANHLVMSRLKGDRQFSGNEGLSKVTVLPNTHKVEDITIYSVISVMQ
jgi:hypothetical protein